jgi:hypothetical protein
MSILLRLKHWHLFLLTAAVYVYAAWMLLFFLRLYSPQGPGASGRTLRLVAFIAFSLWQLTVVMQLHKKLPAQININIGLFLFLFYMAFTYEVLISVLGIVSRLVELPESVRSLFYELTILRMGPFTVYYLARFALTIYFSYIISKLLNTVEKRIRSESGSDMIMLIFLPIGVWWIQPRINKIFSNERVFGPNTPLDQSVTQQI